MSVVPTSAVQPARVAHRGLITIAVMLATVMQTLDTTIANVALPYMQGSMAATQDQISWVLTSYIVAAAICTPLNGFLVNRFGRKRVFFWEVFGFTCVSVLCGVAQSLPEIVTFRILQGIFGAGLVPLSQAVQLDVYEPKERGQAMAIWGIGVMVGPILGPTLGGYLTEFYNWRWVFFINLPVGILALIGIWLFVPETKPNKTIRFDGLGFGLLAIAIGALQMFLDRGESKDWFTSTEIIIEGICAVLFIYLFIVHMFTHKTPFIHPAMFKDRNFCIGLLLIFILGVMLLSTVALLSPFLENLLGYPVLATGFAMAPRGLGTMLSMSLVGHLMRRFDLRTLLVVGLLMMVESLWEMSLFDLNITFLDLFRTGFIQGFGMGFVFVPLSTMTFMTLDQKYRNEGTAMYSLLRNIGSSIGISIVVTLLSQNTQVFHSILAENTNGFNAIWLHQLPTLWDLRSASGLALLNKTITQQASLIAYLRDFRLMMFITLLALPLIFLLRKRTPAMTH
nr:DHA2 family efflux MFS transporter permease subunit [uncultured Tolumonas sp.]